MIRNLLIRSVLAACLMVSAACSHIISAEPSLPAAHPETLAQGRPICSECHTGDRVKGALKPYAVFDHTDVFVRDHKFDAGRDVQVCAICHPGSFCYDCHAGKTRIKPSVLHGDRPDRELIHRGDFLTRHKIEGKVDPTSCYRCHGRANNEKCAACHRG